MHDLINSQNSFYFYYNYSSWPLTAARKLIVKGTMLKDLLPSLMHVLNSFKISATVLIHLVETIPFFMPPSKA